MRFALFFLFSAVTAAIKQRAKVPGAERVTETEVTLDNSYKTGGMTLTPKELGLRNVYRAFCTVKVGSEAEATAVGSVYYDRANKKLVVNDYKTQKQMAEAKDLSKVVVTVIAYGV